MDDMASLCPLTACTANTVDQLPCLVCPNLKRRIVEVSRHPSSAYVDADRFIRNMRHRAEVWLVEHGPTELGADWPFWMPLVDAFDPERVRPGLAYAVEIVRARDPDRHRASLSARQLRADRRGV